MLARLGLAVSLLLAGPAFSQTQPGWIADATTGCRVWSADPQLNESIRWSGGCVNGLAQGRGVLRWFEDGKPSGRNEGEWRGGKQNGRGVSTWANGNRYEGDYRDDRFNGRGVYTWASGDRYEGEFRDDKANGSGTFKKRDGQVYAGIWTNGCFQQGDRQAWVGVSKEECGFK